MGGGTTTFISDKLKFKSQNVVSDMRFPYSVRPTPVLSSGKMFFTVYAGSDNNLLIISIIHEIKYHFCG